MKTISVGSSSHCLRPRTRTNCAPKRSSSFARGFEIAAEKRAISAPTRSLLYNRTYVYPCLSPKDVMGWQRCIQTCSLSSRTRLQNRTRVVDADQSATRAAVLVPFFEREGDYHLLFTLRTSNMPTHKGDVSFPGGRADKEDASLLHTALRESEEEVGLRPADVRPIGPLDDLRTHGQQTISSRPMLERFPTRTIFNRTPGR